jgi:hypothetical protein
LGVLNLAIEHYSSLIKFRWSANASMFARGLAFDDEQPSGTCFPLLRSLRITRTTRRPTCTTKGVSDLRMFSLLQRLGNSHIRAEIYRGQSSYSQVEEYSRRGNNMLNCGYLKPTTTQSHRIHQHDPSANLTTFFNRSVPVCWHARIRLSTPGIRSNSSIVCGARITIRLSVRSDTIGGALTHC